MVMPLIVGTARAASSAAKQEAESIAQRSMRLRMARRNALQNSAEEKERVDDAFFAWWIMNSLIVEGTAAVISFILFGLPVGALVNPLLLWFFYLDPNTKHWHASKKFIVSLASTSIMALPYADLIPVGTLQIAMTWIDAHESQKPMMPPLAKMS